MRGIDEISALAEGFRADLPFFVRALPVVSIEARKRLNDDRVDDAAEGGLPGGAVVSAMRAHREVHIEG